MNYTYYVVYKKYKGIWTKKHIGNNSFIISTLSKTGEGIIFLPMGYYKDSNKILMWTEGFFPQTGEEMVDIMMTQSKDNVIVEKIPSVSVEYVDNDLDHADVERWQSPLRFDINLQYAGNYLKPKFIKTMVFRMLEDKSMIFIANMDFKPEMEDLSDPEVKMTAYKTKAFYNSVIKTT